MANPSFDDSLHEDPPPRREHELERGSGLLVCPISGTVRDDLRSVCGAPCEGEEEEEEAAAALDGDFGGAWRGRRPGQGPRV